ncbi:hypothetical protein AAHC03_0506 [Spirometra sp. Aus1]
MSGCWLSPVTSFGPQHLTAGQVMYLRKKSTQKEARRDRLRIKVCATKLHCELNGDRPMKLVTFFLRLYPLQKRLVFIDIPLAESGDFAYLNITMFAFFLPDLLHNGRLKLLRPPKHGNVLVDNIPVHEIEYYHFFSRAIFYARKRVNVTYDEFVLGTDYYHLPTSCTFNASTVSNSKTALVRVHNCPLVYFRPIIAPVGRTILISEALLDSSYLVKSVEDMKEYLPLTFTNNVTQSIKKALRIIVPQTVMSGEIIVQRDISDGLPKDCPSLTGRLCLSYADIVRGRVNFKSFSNISHIVVNDTMNSKVLLEERVPVLILAHGFMNPAPSQLKIALTTSSPRLTHDIIMQDNILLSDSVDDMRPTKLSSNGKVVNWNFSANGKVGVTVAVGFVCTGLCLLVIMAYFLLRRWRRSLRQQGATTYNQMAFAEQSTNVPTPRNRTKFCRLARPRTRVNEAVERITKADEIILRPVQGFAPSSMASSSVSPEQVEGASFYVVSMPANMSSCTLVTSSPSILNKDRVSPIPFTRSVHGSPRGDAPMVALPGDSGDSPIWNRQSVAGVSKLMFIDFIQKEEKEDTPICLIGSPSDAFGTIGSCEQCQKRTDLPDRKPEVMVCERCNI